MDNQEKLKTSKPIEFVINRREGPFESAKTTMERLQSGDLSPEEISRLEESFSRLRETFQKSQADKGAFLESRQYPPDLTQAVRLAMADLFGEFVSAEDIDEFSMPKIWELLQTAFYRRQWLAKIAPPATIDEKGWRTVTQVANGLGINKGQVSRLVQGGCLRDNGRTGTPRRIDPASVLEYCDREGIAYNDT